MALVKLVQRTRRTAIAAPKVEYFGAGLSRKLLKEEAFKLKNQLESFVAKELFPELKFTVGDEETKAQYCLLALNSQTVQFGHSKINPACFASEFRGIIAPHISKLRQYSQNIARGKYQRKFRFLRAGVDITFETNTSTIVLTPGDYRKDLAMLESDEEVLEKMILPSEGLCGFLMDRTYRDYLDDKGQVRDDQEDQYQAFVWFVKNIVYSVNC